MTRPFYRSRLFWLGVPGVVFLLWGWWDSERHYTEVSWVKPRSFVAAYQHEGRIALLVTEETHSAAFRGPRIQFAREDDLPIWRGGINEVLFEDDSEFSERFEAARSGPFPGLFRRRWSFPYWPSPSFAGSLPWLPYREWGADFWLVVSGYTALWLGTVAGWQRRKLCLLRRQEPPAFGE